MNSQEEACWIICEEAKQITLRLNSYTYRTLRSKIRRIKGRNVSIKLLDEVMGLKKEETGLSRRYLLNCRMSS